MTAIVSLDQIQDELKVAASKWATLVGRGLGSALVAEAKLAAPAIAVRALQGNVPTLNALRAVLGPREPAWYSTSLGRLVAPHWLGESVPVGFAAKMLGVSTGRIHQLLGEGKLLRMDGGVSVQSILDRMEWFDAQK